MNFLNYISRFLYVVLFSLPFFVHSQCSENSQKRIFLMGDSWATYMWYDGTLATVAKDWGHSNIDYYTHLTLNELGSKTDDFLKPEKINKLSDELAARPEIKVIHLSVAGNDFLGNWKASFSQEQIDTIYQDMIVRLDSIIDTIHAMRPDVHIVWSGYTYTNFQESILSVPSSFQSNHPFYTNWQNMEYPTPSQINTLQNWFQQEVQARYASDPKFTYIPASSILQYTFGQTENLSIPPGGTYPPQTVSLPYGNVDYPSPLNSMRHYMTVPVVNIAIKDAFHLSSQGYYDFMSYQFQKFYHKFLMEDVYTVATYANSGSVGELGHITDVLQVGKNGSEEHVGILHFDNSHWEEYIPEKASLFLRIKDIEGANILSSSDFEIDAMEGSFGDFAGLDPQDFHTTASITSTACVFGANETGKWVRLDFPQNFASQLRNVPTQLRIRYTGTDQNKITFYNSTDIDFQAVLTVEYSLTPYPEDEPEEPEIPEEPEEPETPEIPEEPSNPTIIVSLSETDFLSDFQVFPNPVNNEELTVIWDKPIDRLELYDLMGNLVFIHVAKHTVHLDGIQPGVYLLRVESGDKYRQKKVIKY